MESFQKWSDEDYESAITQWVVRELKQTGIKETHFSRDAGLGRRDTDARTFRKLKQGKRHWSIVDLCKIAAYFRQSPAGVLKQVETFYQREGIVRAGKTVENIIRLGFSQASGPPQLISTWRKQGKSFVLQDCDARWKRSAEGKIGLILGLASTDIFPDYPEITQLFTRVWKKRRRQELRTWYTLETDLAKEVLESSDEKKFLAVSATYVPPDQIVVYATDITPGHFPAGQSP